ncbi:hypothetical protein [Vibrio vulnificus]|uniref:hypothetical protein n=1 Tax=Vibrio vulnificus TaxID=672 RepID=UPI00374E128A
MRIAKRQLNENHRSGCACGNGSETQYQAGDVRYIQFAGEGLHGYAMPSVDKALAA